MKKIKTVVIVEQINDVGAWTWYGIYENATPVEALKEYHTSGIGSDDAKPFEVKVEGNETYLKGDDVRAYYVELINLKN